MQDTYAFDDSGPLEHKTHIVMAWLLGDSMNLEDMLEAQLLASVLLDNSASPLQQALETTQLGQSPSPLCGLEESMREMVFACGIEGSESEHTEALEALVMDVLRKVSEEGVAADKLEAVLHQLELAQREISGDSYPYGLQLILTALGNATHYADPIAALNVDPVLDLLRERIKNPDYIRGLAKRLLLDNPHRVTLVMEPDKELSGKRQQAEQDRLAAVKLAMSDADKAEIVARPRRWLHARPRRTTIPSCPKSN